MKIRVYAPGFCDDSLIDHNGHMTIEEGTTVLEVLKKLKTPILLRRILIIAVNYKRVRKSHVLKSGDTLSILGPVSSG